MSLSDVDNAKIAMTSEAAVMSKPLLRSMPSWAGPNPISTFRSARSLTSRTRRHVTLSMSMPSSLP